MGFFKKRKLSAAVISAVLLGMTVTALAGCRVNWKGFWASLELEQSGDAPCKRKYSSMVCGPNGELWLFGGVDENGNVLNDLYRMF